MAAKKPKKTGGSLSGAKLIAIICGGFLLVVAGVLFASYLANKPNYRDLERAYNQLNIPTDWELVSESSNKGTWGLFCWGGPGDTSPCPILWRQYSTNIYGDPNLALSSVLKGIEGQPVESFQKCSPEDLDAQDFDCSRKLITDDVEIYASVSSKDSSGNKGQFATIVISPHEN